MMLKITEKITRILLAITLLCSCGGAGKPSGIPEDTTPKGPAGGLSDARNRKAIIEQLGSRYQQSASGQYRKRIASVAPFKIQLVNGSTYTYQDLAAKKPVVLIYFSPGCEECQHFTRALVKRMNDLKDRQLIFVSYEPLAELKKFYKDNGLDQFPQVKMGTEGYSFIVQKYYKVEHFPFIASYDGQGHLIQIYTDNTHPEKLAAAI